MESFSGVFRVDEENVNENTKMTMLSFITECIYSQSAAMPLLIV